MNIESALVVLIPEADRLLEAFRERYEPASAGSFPAHVTILYPFKKPDDLSTGLSETLRRLFRKQPSFSASFLELECFPDMLYLAPVPAEPFRQLTERVASHFPDTPPYGGEFKEIVPHLTIAQAGETQQLGEIAIQFMEVAKGMLPIHTMVDRITLMENSGDNWKLREQFPLRKTKNSG